MNTQKNTKEEMIQINLRMAQMHQTRNKKLKNHNQIISEKVKLIKLLIKLIIIKNQT